MSVLTTASSAVSVDGVAKVAGAVETAVRVDTSLIAVVHLQITLINI